MICFEEVVMNPYLIMIAVWLLFCFLYIFRIMAICKSLENHYSKMKQTRLAFKNPLRITLILLALILYCFCCVIYFVYVVPTNTYAVLPLPYVCGGVVLVDWSKSFFIGSMALLVECFAWFAIGGLIVYRIIRQKTNDVLSAKEKRKAVIITMLANVPLYLIFHIYCFITYSFFHLRILLHYAQAL